MKIGVIGGGNIAKYLLKSINIDRQLPQGEIRSVLLRRPEAAADWERDYAVQVYQEIDAFLDSGIDIVVEAATVQAVRDYAEKVVARRKNLVVISVGALVDEELVKRLNETCRQFGTRVMLPSGAIGGLDVIHAAMAAGELESVSLTTRKPPLSLIGREVEQEEVVFAGTAAEAIARFPQNINVAIVLSLAGLGSEKTNVRIVADPHTTKNTHCIEAHGAFGKMTIQLENDPMPANPKTSYLAALSVLATLKKQTAYLSVG